MTDTKQVMQQALDALCLPCDRWNGEQTKIINAAIEALRGCLTAPAAEVPEAMGDDLLFRLADDHSESSAGPVGQASEFWAFEQQSLRDFSKALNDALQSTRLRGGVPDEVQQAAQALVDMIVGELPTTGYLRDNDITRAALDRLRKSLTAAPQAPALDAGVVRDAERWRIVRRGQHWSTINGIGDVLRGEALDADADAKLAAMSAQGGGK